MDRTRPPKEMNEQILASKGKDRARKGWHYPGRWKKAKVRMNRRSRRKCRQEVS